MHSADYVGQDPKQVDGILCADECLGATCIRPAGHEGNHRGDRRRGGGRITWWYVEDDRPPAPTLFDEPSCSPWGCERGPAA